MKKVLIGVVAVGGILALRSAARRGGHTMSEHCKQMAGQCMQMAGQSAERGETTGMREHCQEMMAAHKGRGETAETLEPSEQETLQTA